LKAHEVDNRKVFFDHSRVRYFAGAEFQGAVPNNRVYLIDAIKSHRIKDYEYLVINQSPKHPEIEAMVAVELPQFREIKRFYGVGNRKSIAIYKKDN
jgi:hypothetical protein